MSTPSSIGNNAPPTQPQRHVQTNFTTSSNPSSAVASPVTISVSNNHIRQLSTPITNGINDYSSPLSPAQPGDPDNRDGDRTRPKQKRNKPTLSCEECVERKTKCDRGRPVCLSCIKRQSSCHYTVVAEILNSAKSNESGKARYVTKPPIKARKSAGAGPVGVALTRTASEADLTASAPSARKKARSAHGGSPYLLSHLPFSRSTPSNIFGVGSQHPFSNYWTCAGGMPEIVSVLPSKDQADILVAKYMEVIDPVYPCIHRRTFYHNYERFWASSPSEKNRACADMLALHYTIYALGTQFMPFPSYEERKSSSEFYASAANQALQIFSYLNRASLRALVAMLLLTYFLMNDNHASDAYAFSGILLRQAYAMRLHRDPDIVAQDTSEVEKQVRRKIWQAVFFQDTFLTVLLKLPPTATHSDVQPDSLVDECTLREQGINIESESSVSSTVRVENLMSISVIAPPQDTHPLPKLPAHLVDPTTDKQDCDFIRAMWKLGNLVQENLSSPLSLSLPPVSSPRQKTSIISSFRALYRSLPASLTATDIQVLTHQSVANPRSVRQNLFLTSNFYHCLMILQVSENEEAGVDCNVRGTLEAAHEAICAFFKLYQIFENEAGVWWVFQHRAFEEALTIARLLSVPPSAEVNIQDALFARCKNDVVHMIELLKGSKKGSLDVQKTKLEVLQEAFDRVIV